MEKKRQEYFLDTLVSVSTVFKFTELINQLSKEFPIIKFLETLYNAGFYRGLTYGIDSAERIVVPDSDIPVKYSEEIAEEINRSIVEKNLNINKKI